MKRHVFPVLILALILPVLALTGCPQDSGDSTPSGNLGDGDLVLEGTVYTGDYNFQTGVDTYEKYTTAGTVEVWVSNGSAANEKLGEGPLTNGEFDISISKKPAALVGFSALATFFDEWDTPTANPEDVNGTVLFLQLQGIGNIAKGESGGSVNGNEFSGTNKSVIYLYVDKDVTITLGANEGSGTEQAVAYTANAATLKLTRGWNALYREIKGTMTQTSASQTLSVSVGNPDLKWVIQNNGN
jgi:hypothetical protein